MHLTLPVFEIEETRLIYAFLGLQTGSAWDYYDVDHLKMTLLGPNAAL